MTRIVHGTVHGRTIELDEELGVAEGQEVQVQVIVPEVNATTDRANWGEGILRSAGALADDPDWDGIMEEIHDARKRPRHPVIN